MPPKVAQMIREQEEQKIFKEFEEMGYEILKHPHNDDLIQIASEEQDTIIEIYCNKETKTFWYEARMFGVNQPQVILKKEHQLLHKLFELCGVV